MDLNENSDEVEPVIGVLDGDGDGLLISVVEGEYNGIDKGIIDGLYNGF